jgi:molybdopterin-guanine dinucleotide biosynthesis protein A
MNEQIEAVLLTGGASRRMGRDKAKLLVEGEPLAERIIRLLREAGITVTTCGREPIEGSRFLADQEEFAGPLAALSAFRPKKDLVFVCSCDLPGFDSAIVVRLREALQNHDAAVPESNGRLQPLCGLYRPKALEWAGELHREGERRVMKWLDRLNFATVTDIPESWIRNVNSPGDL